MLDKRGSDITNEHRAWVWRRRDGSLGVTTDAKLAAGMCDLHRQGIGDEPVELVPISQLRGAVEALEQIARRGNARENAHANWITARDALRGLGIATVEQLRQPDSPTTRRAVATGETGSWVVKAVGGAWAVESVECATARLRMVARCANEADARMVARALNARWAVGEVVRAT